MHLVPAKPRSLLRDVNFSLFRSRESEEEKKKGRKPQGCMSNGWVGKEGKSEREYTGDVDPYQKLRRKSRIITRKKGNTRVRKKVNPWEVR